MAGHTTPYPPDWKQQRRVLREQARMQREALRAQSRLYREQVRSMRSASILGPLVLIAIGIVFLLIETGRLNGLRAWTWYGHWWPLLLVGAGVLVLGEWAFDRFLASDEKPIARRGIGAGLWLIFIFVICTGVVASESYRFGPFADRLNFGSDNESLAEFLGNLHEMDQPFTQTLPADASLSIDSPRGGVNISGTSTDGLMHIQLRREIYTNSDSDAQKTAQQLVPRVETSGHQVSLSLPYINGAATAMTITVPTTTPLTINTNHGDIDVYNITGPLTLTSSHGNIGINAINGSVHAHVTSSDSSFTAHNITGSVDLDTQGHDITVTDVSGSAAVRSRAGGSTHLERINGFASYHSDRTQFDSTRLDGQFDINGKYVTVDQAVGPVTLVTYSYDITLEHVAGNTTIRNSNGSIDLVSAPPLGSLSIDNRGGPVSVTVPIRSSFTIEANGNNSQIFSEFTNLQQQKEGTHAILTGTIGNGGPLVRITTSRGDISLHRADLQPLPAAPPPLHPASTATGLYHPPPTSDEAREAVRQAILDSKQAVSEAKSDAQQARRDAQGAIRDAHQAIREASQKAQ